MGGSSRHLDNCYYKPIGKSIKKGNFPFATIAARNADKSPITSYTVVKGALPPGMSLHKTTGMIFGKPKDVEKAKGYDFTVKAEGKNDPIERSFSIEVRHRKSVDIVSTDFSQGTGKVFKYHGSCNSKCEIASDSAGNIKLDGSNGNDAIIMQKPLLVGDFEYGCTVTSGSSGHNRFGMGLWDQASSSHFRSSNSAGYCAQASSGSCYFCRFEQSTCSFRGGYGKVFGLNNIHDMNARFMFKRVNGEICGYMNDKKQGCYPQKTSAPMYGAIQNDGGSSRNMHKCYYKTSSEKVVYE